MAARPGGATTASSGSSGSRGLTVTLWDRTNARLESVTTGRAAGADPGFARSWTTPLLWGASAETLAAGPFTLQGGERRDDGTGVNEQKDERQEVGVELDEESGDADERKQEAHRGVDGVFVHDDANGGTDRQEGEEVKQLAQE